MRSWYEFGFNGFPTGEQRRRFYRQRDDPCDSEEERDCDDDETNDRPIYYYPLRESEEGSRSSYDSVSSGDGSGLYEEEEDISREGETAHGVTRTRRPRRHPRRALQEQPTARCALHSTLYEDLPAWYGATAVSLDVASAGLPAVDSLTLQHGGAPCASPLAISGQVSVWHWSSSVSTTSATAAAAAISSPSSGHRGNDEAMGSLRCTRVPDDPSLLSRLCWDKLHPTLRLARSSPTRPLPRIGHCAAALANVDSSLLQFFLTDHRTTHTAINPGVLADPRTGSFSKLNAETRGLLRFNDVEVFGTLVLGGALQLVNASTRSVSRSRHGGALDAEIAAAAAAAADGPNLNDAAIPHACALSHPVLCLTLWQRGIEGGGGSKRAAGDMRQHSIFFPLDTPSMSIAAPRAFATLTPWVDPTGAPTAACAFAYIGGTENGRDPLAFLELEIFRLHLETWAWSCTPVTTYGAKPAPRFGHSTNVVDDGEYLLMFGGIGMGHTYLNDLHVLDVRTRVWREVFIPFGLEIPRRAFHMSAVLANTAAPKRSKAAASSLQPHLSAFTVQARMALRHDVGVGYSERCSTHSEPFLSAGGDVRSEVCDAEEVEAEEDDAVWSSSVTNPQSRCDIVFLGGESEGSPVATSWVCALRNGKWQRLSFPLRTLPHFFHVAWSSADGDADTRRVRRQLPRAEFRAAVESLVERMPCSAAQASRLGSFSSSHDDTYVAACHGSLAQLLVHPDSSCHTVRIVVVGGSRGPPVSVATQLEMMNVNLKSTTSLWLLAAHRQSPLSETVLRRVPNLPRFFFHNDGVLSRAVGSLLQPDDVAAERRRRPLSDADVRSNRLVSESVLEGQLTEWLRLARKRLRDFE